MTHPLDPDTGPPLLELARHHLPFVGAAMQATRAAYSDERKISLWQLIVAISSLGVLLGGIIWSLAAEVTNLENRVRAFEREQTSQDSSTAYIRRRQEINEERIGKLETQSALDDQRYAAMEKQHAEMFAAIREAARKR